MTTKQPNLLTTKAAAERLEVSVRKLQRHRKLAGVGVRLGRDWLIAESDLPKLKKAIAASETGERKRKALEGNEFWRLRKPRKKLRKTSKKQPEPS